MNRTSPSPRKPRTFLIGMLVAAFALPAHAADPEAGPEHGYRLQPGDQLRVIVPGPEPLDALHVVNLTGEVDLGNYGLVSVGNMNIAQAERRVKEHLRTYIRNVQGVQLVFHRRGRMVLITGVVTQPGFVRMEEGEDLWQLIQKAGGLAAGADLTRVLVIREGEESQIDLRSYLTRETNVVLPELRAGDTIFVSAEPGLSRVEDGPAALPGPEALGSKVIVVGEVHGPGVYDRSPGMDAMSAIGLAGGPTGAADLSAVHMVTPTGRRVLDLMTWLGKESESQVLQGNGSIILFVPGSATGVAHNRLQQHVNVMGEVNAAGRIVITAPVTMSDALGLAGGPTVEADLNDVRLMRKGKGFSLSMRYEVGTYLEEGGELAQMPLESGDTLVVEDRWFRTGEFLGWSGLLVNVALTAALLFAI